MNELILNKNNFNEMVLLSDRPVIVDFWAPWCSPCRVMGSVISELAERSDGSYAVGKVNIDEEQNLAELYGIKSIPTIKVFKNGRAAASGIGVMTPHEIRNLLKEAAEI